METKDQPAKKSQGEILILSIEMEICILLSARQSINSIVNRSVLSIEGDMQNSVTIRPTSMEAAALVSILLVDFISRIEPPFGIEPPCENFRSHVEALKQICEHPHFNFNESIFDLKNAVKVFDEWLLYEATFEKVWLPSAVDEELQLKMKREEFLRICGDISKHSTLRLSRTAKRILEVLQRSNSNISLHDAFSGMEDFYRWFHNDVFHYHLTKICEMLNNISWGIQAYLTDEYNRSYTVDLEKSRERRITCNSFQYPTEVKSQLGKYFYWGLMNEIRAKPYIEKFKASKYTVGRY